MNQTFLSSRSQIVWLSLGMLVAIASAAIISSIVVANIIGQRVAAQDTQVPTPAPAVTYVYPANANNMTPAPNCADTSLGGGYGAGNAVVPASAQDDWDHEYKKWSGNQITIPEGGRGADMPEAVTSSVTNNNAYNHTYHQVYNRNNTKTTTYNHSFNENSYNYDSFNKDESVHIDRSKHYVKDFYNQETNQKTVIKDSYNHKQVNNVNSHNKTETTHINSHNTKKVDNSKTIDDSFNKVQKTNKTVKVEDGVATIKQ